MYYNRNEEFRKQQKIINAWNISNKYTRILMEHEKNDESIDIFDNIYHQYLSELKHKKIDTSNKKNYIKIWITTCNTLHHNIKINVCRASLKLLHQTSQSKSFSVNPK